MNKHEKRPNPQEDDKTHINTHSKTKSKLGSVLSPSYETGEPLNHPILGHFRSVENGWHWLNTGGNRDRLRTMLPADARNLARLTDKYRCDKFRELILDLTIIKLRRNPHWWAKMAECDLPFDHYFVRGKGKEIMTVRPGHSDMYISILNEVREIARGNKEHSFVRFSDMNFTKLEEGK